MVRVQFRVRNTASQQSSRQADNHNCSGVYWEQNKRMQQDPRPHDLDLKHIDMY